MASKDVVLIIGSGRSGTSAITRVLSLCGWTLPEAILGAVDINPRGCWEPIDIWKLNGDFMLRHGTAYADPTMRLQDLRFEDEEREKYIGQIRTFIRECSHESALLIKQPEITELMDFWLDACGREGLFVKVVIAIRHPHEVYASMAAAHAETGHAVSLEAANAFWLKRNLLAERSSRAVPRVFVEYTNLLKGWRREVARVSKALAIEVHPNEAAIDNFLSEDLHRQRCAHAIRETFGYSWVTRVYATLSACALDAPIDLPTMDEIYHAYRTNERTFRVAWDEFRSWFNLINSSGASQGEDSAPIWKSGRDF